MLLINRTPVPIELAPPQPKPPFGRRPRLREIDCSKPLPCHCRPAGNTMYDQRVRRGSNFVRMKPQTPPPEPSRALQRKLDEARRRLLLKMRIGANAGCRVDVDVQCEQPEETLTAVASEATQTDLTPGYLQLQDAHMTAVKCKTGSDRCTQVTHRDLVDYETEVYPLTEVLTASVLEQAAVCVFYEDGAAALRREQAVYEAKRRAERFELDRLERNEAVSRRNGLSALARAESADPGPTFRAVHGVALASAYMAGVQNDALGQLQSVDYLKDENLFIDWLHRRIAEKSRQHSDARLNALIHDVIVNRPQVYPDACRHRASEKTYSFL